MEYQLAHYPTGNTTTIPLSYSTERGVHYFQNVRYWHDRKYNKKNNIFSLNYQLDTINIHDIKLEIPGTIHAMVIT